MFLPDEIKSRHWISSTSVDKITAATFTIERREQGALVIVGGAGRVRLARWMILTITRLRALVDHLVRAKTSARGYGQSRAEELRLPTHRLVTQSGRVTSEVLAV